MTPELKLYLIVSNINLCVNQFMNFYMEFLIHI